MKQSEKIFSTVKHWLMTKSDASIHRFDQTGALIGLVLLIATFSFLSPSFRQVGNLILIATMASTIGLVAVGQTLVLITGGIDLSVSSIVALVGLSTASLMKYGFGPIPPLDGSYSYLAILIGLLLGMLIGAFQGWLIAYRRMPSFIVTLGMMVGLRGLAQSFSYGLPTHSLPDNFKWISDGQLWVIPVSVIIMLLVFFFAWYILNNTKFGRYCFAIGGNETATRLSGINVNRYRTYVYMISGFLAGLAGMILMAYIDGAAPTNGDSYELYSVAAAVIGGVSLSGGVGNVWGTLIGVMIITVIPNGLIMLNAFPWWRDTITGAIILIAVVFDVGRQQARMSTPKTEDSPPILTGHYMNEVLSRLIAEISLRLGSVCCRIYLADRDTGDLIPQDMPIGNDLSKVSENHLIPRQGNIVYKSKETRRPICVADIKYRSDVVPMNAEVQSVMVLPLLANNRVMGSIEVQSPIPDVFHDDAVKKLSVIANSMKYMLEDSWLLENGWLLRQIRDSLRHLWDDLYLGRSPLIEWAFMNQDLFIECTPAKCGDVLRQTLIEAIESLKDDIHDNTSHRDIRVYQILKLTYIDELLVDAITKDLHISRRQYFYDLKNALETLADVLVRNHQLQVQH